MSFQTSYIYDLVDKISPKLQKVNSSLQKTATQARKTAKKASNSFKKFSQSLDKTIQKASRLGKSLFLRLSVPLGLVGGSFIKAASDAEETSSKFATVFKDISKQSEQTAKDLGKNFGLSSIKAKELLGDTGDLLTGFGFTGDMALDLSKRVNELAVDLASFTNFSGGAEGASKALTKALLGERESVKSLGISILEEDVKAKIKALIPTGKLTGMTLRQAKAYATLELAISQSGNAIGDFERTSQSFANQSRIFNARLLDLRISFGRILLPIATKFIQKITALAEKFTQLSPTTKKLILIFSGLAIVLPPLLILLGALPLILKGVALGFKGVGISISFLAGPVGITIAAVGALLAVSKDLRIAFAELFTQIFEVGKKVFDFLTNGFNSITDSFTNFLEKFKFADIEGSFSRGRELDNILEQQRRELSFRVERSQSVDVGGTLGININAPSGTSANFTPVNNNPMRTNMSFTQSNPLLN